jgi:hypothetical protein
VSEQLAFMQDGFTVKREAPEIEPPIETRRGRQPKDLTGQRFGRLVAVELTDERDHGNAVWICRCDCGSTIRLSPANFRSGTKSCGCIGRGSHGRSFIRGGVGSRQAGAKPLIHQEELNFRDLYSNYRYGATRRGYTWSLSHSEFAELTKLDCHYCGAPPEQTFVGRRGHTDGQPYIYNGVDRVDNERGYEMNNVIPCCGTCNVAKMGRDYHEFTAWILRAADHLSRL